MKHMRFDGKIRKGISLLLAFMLVFLSVPGAWAADGAADPLKPDDLSYDHENIILHKQAKRIGPDKWRVNVRATIKDEPIVKQGMEVVFVLDVSGSMSWCTDEEEHELGSHTHNNRCYSITCGKNEHSHSSGCYEIICGMNEHVHSVQNGCYGSGYSCGKEEHQHSSGIYNSCYERCTRQKNPSHYGNGNRHLTSGTNCISIMRIAEKKNMSMKRHAGL